ncbi:zinc-ribbon domain-containing protein [Mammaliicoccus sciuri]|uniref:TcaA NTF2-like domain-containing protein n=1 Tax=Mammaliicoccus sciuri TaxID=1296 RepID=UPI003364F312
MKYCKNCGNKLSDGQKICTQCGTPVAQENQANQHVEHKKMNKKPLIIIAIIALLFLLIFAVYKVIESQLSPVNEAEEIASDIKKGNTKSLKNHLKFNNRDLSQTESKALYDYVVEADSTDRFADEVKTQVKDMKDSGAEGTTISAGKQPVIQVKKNGKKYGIFDNYEFEVLKENVSIHSDSDSVITYDYNGKKENIKLSKDNTKVFATLPIGNYHLDATKAIDDKKFKGELIVNMVDSLEVVENFKQKMIKVKIDTAHSYGAEDIDIYINGKKRGTYHTFDKTTYGPFLPDEKVDIYAQTKVNGKVFKTKTVNVTKADEGKDEITVDLSFDDDAIKDYKENEELKEDVQKFMEDYTEALNKAYEEEDYMYVSSYIKSGTDIADHIENVVEKGGSIKFSTPKVTKYDKKDDTITIEVEKKDQDGESIKSKYVLDYNSLFSDFKIIDYTDI